MPAAPTSDRSRIESALAALQRALSELDAPWMVIGGIAVIAHGVQRMTTDIDAVIRGDAVAVRAVLTALRRHQIGPRIADAEAFAATNLVLLTRHRPTDVTTGQLGDQFHRITGVPGTTPRRLSPTDRSRGPGSP